MNFLSVLYAKAGITVDGVTALNNTATALTPTTSDNSTKIATTAFVKNQNYYPYPTGTTAQYVRGDGSLATLPSIAAEAQRLITEVYNETGATLTKGTVVYINGGHGNLPTVTKALATSDATSAQTYGVVQNDITDNNNGFVVVIGSITDIPTNTYLNGTILYLSPITAGEWTSTKPYAPQHIVYVGIVTRSHPTQGVVEVRVQNGYEMDELHNVSAQSPANGDILQFDFSTQLWTKTTGNTTAIAEGTNLYFTDARARAALSFAAGSGAYNTTTGVITIPTNNNQIANGAGYITSSALSSYLPLAGGTLTGNLTLQYDYPRINLYDTNHDSDYSIINNDGAFSIFDVTNNSHRLSIASTGAATFSSSVTAASYIKAGGDFFAQINGGIFFAGTGAYNSGVLSTSSGNELILRAGSATRAFVTAGGDFLVGTTSSIWGTTNRNVIQVNGASQALIGLSVGDVDKAYLFHQGTNLSVWNVANGYIEFGTNNTTRLTIAAGGNVGINTTSPASAAKLHIVADSSTSSIFLDAYGARAGFLGRVASGTIASPGYITLNYNMGAFGVRPWNGTDFYSGGNTYISFVASEAHALNALGGRIVFQTTLNGTVAGVERMRIENNGNVLIGTTTDEGYKLYVNGGGLFNGVVTSYATMDHYARRINSPEGASYVTTASSITGAIKIKLPVATNNSNTMMMFRVKLYQYNTGNCHEFQIAGYNYGLGNWYNISVTDLTDNGSNFNVRFGTDATSDCVWIGETSSTWVYPQVFVTDFQAGYGGNGINWATGWAISFETAFDTVEQTRLASQVITSRSIGAQSVNYAVSAGDAATLGSYAETSFIRLASNSSSPTNGNFAIGNASSRNFIQSHSGQPLDLNPLGNAVTINGYTPITSSNIGSQSVSSASTATNISNTGTVTLATATEANSIYITQPSYTTNQPVKLLNFDWYGEVWSMGNIRSSGATTAGFGIYLSGSEKFRFNRDGEAIFQNRVTTTAWTTTGRNYSNEWIEFPNYTGLYSANNNAHFAPNGSSYGSWKIQGSRNGWNGLEFGDLTNGNITLMVAGDSSLVGFHNNSYSWQFYWSGGTMYVGKGANGGSTVPVLDASNVGSYAVKLYGTINNNIDSDYGECFVTFDPIPSGTPPLSSPNIRTINVGNSYSRRTQLAFDYASDKAYFRRRTEAGWFTWREFVHSGNVDSYALPISGGTLTGSVTATDFYTSGWFRNSVGNKGLYNSAYNTHLYSRAAGVWSIASSNSALGYLELWYKYYDEAGAEIKGSLAWDSAGFGLLNNEQSEYSVLCYQGSSYGGTLKGDWNIDGANLSINSSASATYSNITYSSSLDPFGEHWYSGMAHDSGADETYYYIYYSDGNQFRLYADGTIYINGGAFSQYTATSNYISVGAYGLYSSTYSAYFRRNDASSYAPWELVGAKGGYTGMYYSASNQPHIMFNTSNGYGGLYYQTGSRWVLYYDYSNNCLGVGQATTSASYKLYVTGAIYATGAIVANSDGRNKENVEVVENALDKVNSLRGVTYTKKDQDSGKREMGVIAQEVLPHVPEVIQYAEDLDQYGVSYGNFAGLFIEAIKEQQVLINELKSEIEILKNK